MVSIGYSANPLAGDHSMIASDHSHQWSHRLPENLEGAKHMLVAADRGPDAVGQRRGGRRRRLRRAAR